MRQKMDSSKHTGELFMCGADTQPDLWVRTKMLK